MCNLQMMVKIMITKILRLKCNLTNDDVAKMMNVSLRTVFNWNDKPPADVVDELRKVDGIISQHAFKLQRPIHYHDWKERYPELSEFNDDVQLAILERCITRTGIKDIRYVTPWTEAIDALQLTPNELVKLGYKDARDVYYNGAEPVTATARLLGVTHV